MRLLIALPDDTQALAVCEGLAQHMWEMETALDGAQVLSQMASFDMVLLHQCMPGMDGMSIGEAFAAAAPLCSPRILFICPPEFLSARPRWADALVYPGVSTGRLCSLLVTLAQKPLPRLAAAHQSDISASIECFLDELSLNRQLKGCRYAAWLLERMIPSPLSSEVPIGNLYTECARHFQTTPASVERCLRIAVESIFTHGSMRGIERYFGATVDPERGKPTNRAFLLQAAEQLRLLHSRAEARSPNSREMHHSPAPPTSV